VFRKLLVVVLLVAVSSILFSLYAGQTSNKNMGAPIVFSQNDSIINLCVISKAGCERLLMEQIKFAARKQSNVKIASANTLHCKLLETQINHSYESNLLANLKLTNTGVDNARHNAEITGESYNEFDNQVNNITAIYNKNIESLYQTGNSDLHNCHDTLTAPILFQAFTP
jgi:hypothetical protein